MIKAIKTMGNIFYFAGFSPESGKNIQNVFFFFFLGRGSSGFYRTKEVKFIVKRRQSRKDLLKSTILVLKTSSFDRYCLLCEMELK